MRKLTSLCIVLTALALNANLNAHCQMPCGIYHDDMVYDQIDQYVETMYKAVSELNTLPFNSVKDKHTFMRWVIQKEKQSDDIAYIIMEYFLQQKIKPGEADTTKKLEAAHRLLFLIVGIKQNTDVSFVHQFMEEWDDFKHMFHREGYECKIELIKLKKWKEEAAALRAAQQKTKEINQDNGKATESDLTSPKKTTDTDKH